MLFLYKCGRKNNIKDNLVILYVEVIYFVIRNKIYVYVYKLKGLKKNFKVIEFYIIIWKFHMYKFFRLLKNVYVSRET